MRERCPGCGLRFERSPGHWVGSLGMNTTVSFAALLVTIVVGVAMTAPDIPVGPLTSVALVVAVVVPLLFFPSSRTLWTAIDVLMHPLEPGELREDPPSMR